ncbi:hypothetical protein BASA50_002125 [Batrachochytrium salamandrivorans]|uniref:DNA-directed RNA polymerase I subunit RPA49 n=1 Tax=Batrachochytrium salamandrivorans TaxID=1357716 RepID=A0ABQ8FPV5_9FUNG|nr:hypothetical protein BASA60_008149 [Batrachochytrium salamandrivorans]KAH6575080.1 hypothetical protein BASA62_002117 [Batrachochytrium salamandrivorans]KAH6584816.1 hypothetical protein BASA61_007184 [Batrachochytrium salamandrivorans]KAH6600561.1 hypothetical protein BASA50_002125 [Batrachochytrium salamandrivorans]KAH9255955.1 hypothetical protein BASA81_005991 [Batrachochytrium salamandrivorans]
MSSSSNKHYRLKAERNDSSLIYLTTFPVPPKSIDTLRFDVYGKPVPADADTVTQILSKKRRLVVAETAKMEYIGEPSASNCKYIVGILDKSTGEVSLHDASPLTMTTIVKSQKQGPSKTISDKNMLARNQLGEAFGTKKRKKAIRALEQNKVDVVGLHDVASAITDKIQETSALLPTKAVIDATMLADRDIPPCNVDASMPSEVYKLSDVAPSVVLDAINVKQLWKARLEADIQQSIQEFRMTNWVTERLMLTVQEQKEKSRAKMLIYLSMLIRFYGAKAGELNKNPTSLFGNFPIIGEHVLSQFSEWQEDGSGKRRLCVSLKLKDKLLAYILVLCLHLNNFTINTAQIAYDLSISIGKIVSICKELGCRIETVRPAGSGKSGEKHAVLSLPLTFSLRRR